MRSPYTRVPVPLSGGNIDTYTASSIEQLLQPTSLPTGASEPSFDHGGLLWPGAVLLAQLLASGPTLEGLTTLELGCGTGLCSLAAAARGASSVATDISPLSLQLTTHAAAEQGLDVQAPGACRARAECVQSARSACSAHAVRYVQAGYFHPNPNQAGYFDLACTSRPLPPADLVLAADVLYLSELTRSVASRIAEARARGSLVLLTALAAGRKKASRPHPCHPPRRRRPRLTCDASPAISPREPAAA